MNFDEAINAHVAWKMKLVNYLQKPDKSLDPNAVCKDNQCTLGKWIYGEGGSKYGTVATFSQLKTEHAKFHNCAADIIRRADKGEVVSTEVTFSAKSPYSQASIAVTQLLMDLRRNVEKKAA